MKEKSTILRARIHFTLTVQTKGHQCDETKTAALSEWSSTIKYHFFLLVPPGTVSPFPFLADYVSLPLYACTTLDKSFSAPGGVAVQEPNITKPQQIHTHLHAMMCLTVFWSSLPSLHAHHHLQRQEERKKAILKPKRFLKILSPFAILGGTETFGLIPGNISRFSSQLQSSVLTERSAESPAFKKQGQPCLSVN